jgi:WS/DGAT/MGAT family acyltransferase
MNDILLEIVSSSLRRGLMERGELPEEAIVGLCPVSLRQGGDQSFGNQISSMPVSLATDIGDLSKRLSAIHESAEAAKRRLERGAFETFSALGECLAPGVLRWLTGVAHAFPSILPLPANLVISNVRALPVPMYLAGARVAEFYPLSMLQVANGMNVTAVSHVDQVDFGFLVDSNLVPDPWIYAEGVQAAVRELEAAVAANSRRRDGEIDAAAEAALDAIEEAQDPPGDAEDPIDLALMISQLGHLRSPPRHDES